MSSSSNKIVLTSSDGEFFEIEERIACEFHIVANMIEDGCSSEKPILIPNVTGKILAKVIEYCKKHVDDAAADSNEEDEKAKKKKKKQLEDWDNEFTGVDYKKIFHIILAANYLNIKSLLDLCCQKVADYIKDKQPEEVRALFNIENDFTPEEEAAIREENKWAFE